MHKSKILVLGSASWLGSILISKLDRDKFEITATYFNRILDFTEGVKLTKAKSINDYKQILNDDFDIIINFLRGEDENGFNIHLEIIDYCKASKAYYSYCSSALALDACTNKDLTEDKLAQANSDYGMFKARCERMLYDSPIDWSIFRFSSLQGYCAHKNIRNEVFLKQLQQNNTVFVDQKVFQNRMYADDAVDIILEVLTNKITGILHLGTTDASDEIDFLRKQARLFGYHADLVMPKKNIRNVNLNCIPERIHQIFPKSRYFTQADTLEKLSGISAYNIYKKQHVL